MQKIHFKNLLQILTVSMLLLLSPFATANVQNGQNEKVAYHQEPKPVNLSSLEQKIAESIRHQFGLKNAKLPSLDSSLVISARIEAEAILSSENSGGLENLRHNLRQNGVSDYFVQASMIKTTKTNAPENLAKKLSEWAAGKTSQRFNRLGVGVTMKDDSFVAVVILSRRMVMLDKIEAYFKNPKTEIISGRTDIGIKNLELHLSRPDGKIISMKPKRISSGAFSETLNLDKPGTYMLEVLIDEGYGPQIAALMNLCVTNCKSSDNALKFNAQNSDDLPLLRLDILRWINNFRKMNHLKPLKLSRKLSKIEQQWIGRFKPNDPLRHLDDKGHGADKLLEQAGLATLAYGENLGRNNNLEDLLHKLAQSPAHRKNLLNSASTHIGIAVNRLHGMWIMGQLFVRFKNSSKNVVKIIKLPDDFLNQLNSARGNKNLVPIRRNAKLDRIAKLVMQKEIESGKINIERLRQNAQARVASDPNSMVKMIVVLQAQTISELVRFSVFSNPEFNIYGISLVQMQDSSVLALVLLGRGNLPE